MGKGGGVTRAAAAAVDGEADACERVWKGRGNYAGNDGKYKPGEFHQGMYPGFSRVEREYKYGESALLSSRRTIVVLVSFPTEC